MSSSISTCILEVLCKQFFSIFHCLDFDVVGFYIRGNVDEKVYSVEATVSYRDVSQNKTYFSPALSFDLNYGECKQLVGISFTAA